MTREITIDSGALPIHCELQVAGTLCRVETNSPALGQVLRTWQQRDLVRPAGQFSMQVLVTDQVGDRREIPHFRGLHHLVIASFGGGNVFLFDLARRNVVATISEQVASDQLFWDRLLLPIAIGVLGAALGVVPVHCACLAVDGAGLLIAGSSGAGKSTLSVALAQSGFSFVSDDWTYLSQAGAQLMAHGMSTPAKLLPDCKRFFPFLAEYPIRPALNQEMAFELPPRDLNTRVELSCQPRWFLFLRRSTGECRLDPVSPDEARRYVERSVESLPPELAEIERRRAMIIEGLSHLSCWELTYGGPPEVAVRRLQKFVAQQMRGVLV